MGGDKEMNKGFWKRREKPVIAERDLVLRQRVEGKKPISGAERDRDRDAVLRERAEGKKPIIGAERDSVERKRVEEEYGLFFPCRRKTIMEGVDLGLKEVIDPDFKVGDEYFKEEPEFDVDMDGKETGWALKAETLDVPAILASIGTRYLVTKHGSQVDVERLREFNLIIASFFVPVCSGRAVVCRTLVALSHHLSKEQVKDFRIVIVAKMRQNWVSDEDEFNRFFSGFPDTCLAIPFSDSASRDYISKALDLSSICYGTAVVVVDPYGKVFPQHPFQMLTYGVTSYPFSLEGYEKADADDQALIRRFDSFSPQPSILCSVPTKPETTYDSSPMSLTQLLSCRPEDHGLLQILGPDMTKPAPVSALDGKLVGLYLCYDGSFMKRVHELQQQVKKCRPQLEIVLVPLSFRDDPDVFLKHATLALHKHKISSWWAVPYNDILCRNLWRISGLHYTDWLILLPFENVFSGEIEAFSVTSLVGSKIYPFTRQMLYSERLNVIQEVNLVSLLGERHPDLSWCGSTSRDPVPVKDLEDTKIILYLDAFQSIKDFHKPGDQSNKDSENKDSKKIRDLLQKHYLEILLRHPGTMLVCVPTQSQPESELLSKLTALVLPPQTADNVCKALFSRDFGEQRRNIGLVSVGQNGRICSRRAEEFLYKDAIESLFNWNLDQEIASDVDSEILDLANCI